MNTDTTLSEAELRYLYNNLHTLNPAEQEEILRIAEELQRRRMVKKCQLDLIEFCKYMQPDYKVGRHHRILANLLMEIAEGKKDRICVNIPPRHGKSQLVSIYFPAWFLGKHPDKKVLMVSHTTDLAVDFGRKVRNIIDSDSYKSIFPTVTLAADSKSAGRWNTNSGGEYYACGVGSALAGRGADLLLVDDPHSEQDVLGGNYDVFGRAYEWFTYGARTRLMPGGRVAIVQCMTGDTPVLMADNSEKPLRNVRPGDCVATHDHGVLTTSHVLQHSSNGFDQVFAINTTCGKVAKANERHPFLVDAKGELRWVRLKDLKPGDTLVSLKGVRVPPQPRPDRASATTATSLLDMAKQKIYCAVPQNTYDFTLTQIKSITPAGWEEVFDLQVERTENFIANGLVSHNTRWHMDDLTGRVTRDMIQNEMSDQYEVVEFPAILSVENQKTGEFEQKALWPEWLPLEALLKTKASMPLFQWNSQYQQEPTAEESALVQREWWRVWERESPPSCEYIIMSLDAAAEKHNRADFTAITVWGVFFNEEENNNQIILLNSVKDRVEFPELKEMARAEYDFWKPDSFIVEKKSSGTPLYQELRRTGMIVQEYTPHRGSGDKFARLNSVADIIKAGMVWLPQTRFAEELVEEIAGFPFVGHDDLVDSTIMALMRYRQGGFIRLPSDEPEPKKQFKSRRNAGYY